MSRAKSVLNIWVVLSMLIPLMGVSGCNGENMNSNDKIGASKIEITDEKLSAVARKKIYFGHQSVGFNIINGIADVQNQYPAIDLNILKVDESIEGKTSYFAHTQIGKNRDPQSKIDDFSIKLKSGIGNKVDIAFLKFCYVDITKKTDVSELFESYKEEMSNLKYHFPDTKFVHVTAPLKTVQTGIKAIIKDFVGKPAGGYESNIMRNKYNELLRAEYLGKEPIFDLAMIEATKPDGSMEEFNFGNENYMALNPEYTDDGGHLNKYGQKIVAENLLIFLSELK